MILLLAFTASAFGHWVQAADDGSVPTATPGHIPVCAAAIAIDGLVDEKAWDGAWSMDLEYEVRPAENIPAPVRTQVLMMHSRTHLYVAFRAYDPEPGAIRAHLSDRDRAWNDDWVGVVLDTFNDERRNYLLVANPFGVQMDKIEAWPNGGSVWDGIWQSAGRITEWGWSAEMKIPFSTLRFQRTDGPQTWGFDAIRAYPRNVHRQMGAFVRDRNNNCYLCQAVKIEGFDGVSPGKNLEIVPTLTAAGYEERSDFPDGDFDVKEDDVEFGITARWGLTPNLTLAGTINPDFSQVEADAKQLDVNETFAIFFPEKRPFFMEGADFFETNMRAVYTRMIRDPSWGLKLTGKEGANTIGAYVVEDDTTNIIFPGSQSSDMTSLNMSNTSTVLRYERDIDNRFTIGALLTDREGGDYLNRVAGVDGDFRLSDKDRISAQALWSSTQYPDEVAEEFGQPEGDFDDLAVDLFYSHSTRTISFWGLYRDIGDDFRADLGFIPQVGYRLGEVGFDYTWIGEPGDWYSEMVLIAMVNSREDQDGNLLRNEAAVRFTYEGPLQSHAFIRPSRARERFGGQEFDLDQIFLHICLKPNRHSHAWLNVIIGDRIDYENVQAGERLNIDAGFWYKLGRHLKIEPHFTLEEMDVDAGRLYEARIGQLEASWQFNSRAFVRAIFQHVNYDFATDLYSDGRDPKYEHLFTQLLFSYKVNPQTVFFLGYSDNSIGDQDIHLTRVNRTVFAKIGYAWVF
ncbi:MAG: carbohydrate binding family 9 domain-containing protein [Thermoanaerobaculales bacterium]|nr:carbohydrate binding family 9 domain-containing protein [Thermoanaerobaculales bacterium]